MELLELQEHTYGGTNEERGLTTDIDRPLYGMCAGGYEKKLVEKLCCN
jgi:hypothetical protein